MTELDDLRDVRGEVGRVLTIDGVGPFGVDPDPVLAEGAATGGGRRGRIVLGGAIDATVADGCTIATTTPDGPPTA